MNIGPSLSWLQNGLASVLDSPLGVISPVVHVSADAPSQFVLGQLPDDIVPPDARAALAEGMRRNFRVGGYSVNRQQFADTVIRTMPLFALRVESEAICRYHGFVWDKKRLPNTAFSLALAFAFYWEIRNIAHLALDTSTALTVGGINAYNYHMTSQGHWPSFVTYLYPATMGLMGMSTGAQAGRIMREITVSLDQESPELLGNP